MKTGNLFKKWTAALVAVLMMVSLFAIPAFAAEEAAEEGNGINTGLIIGLIVGAVVLAIVVILCIKFREKLGKFFRVYKSVPGQRFHLYKTFMARRCLANGHKNVKINGLLRSALTSCRPWAALHRTWSGTASDPARPGYPECRG